MAPKMFYNDRVKYLIKNYKEGAINVVPDHVFGSGYSISL